MVKIEVDTSEMNGFFEKCNRLGGGELKKEFELWLEAVGMEFLRIIEDEIISKNVIDTSNLVDSFTKGDDENVWSLSDGNLTLEVGTNVKYAKYANDGHWQDRRFVPGDVVLDGSGKVVKFKYRAGANTGIMLTAKYVEGKKYWESGLRIIEKMIPKLMERKMIQWLNAQLG